jgi:hypothetical protein
MQRVSHSKHTHTQTSKQTSAHIYTHAHNMAQYHTNEQHTHKQLHRLKNYEINSVRNNLKDQKLYEKKKSSAASKTHNTTKKKK